MKDNKSWFKAQLSLAPITAEVIRRTRAAESISEMFNNGVITEALDRTYRNPERYPGFLIEP